MLNYSCINHVYYAYASVTADGSVFVSPDELPSFATPLIGEKKLRRFHLHDVARPLTFVTCGPAWR